MKKRDNVEEWEIRFKEGLDNLFKAKGTPKHVLKELEDFLKIKGLKVGRKRNK